ncbi:MAG: virginiamycin B lyase family protein [Acidimicrobiia bacterium]
MTLVGSVLVVAAPAASPIGVVTSYTGTGVVSPWGIASGTDGALWFTNYGSNTIGQVTTAGVVTNFTGTSISNPEGIAAGPDGNMWFTNSSGNSIGRITTAGVVTSFTGAGIAAPRGIASGSDGSLWFTNFGNASAGSIGRITTAGVVTDFVDPGISRPVGIAAGPDGSMWFTNSSGNSIGRITTAGVVTSFTGAGISSPRGIAAGSDGALWFTNLGNASIGRISTAGTVANITGTGISSPSGIAAGSDGALWFTNAGCCSIGRVTVGGAVSEYTGTGISSPQEIAPGSDGALWFTNLNGGSIGRIDATPAPVSVSTSSLPSGQVGVAYSTTVAASGGITPYSWATQSGSLPPGLSLSTAGVISGTPTAAGTYNFVVQGADSGAPAGTATRSLAIMVTQVPVNLAPTANAQAVTTISNAAVPVTLSGSDPEGSALTFAVTTPPSHGSLSGSAPSLTYSPAAGFVGADSFSFTVSDLQNTSTPATVSITVMQSPTTPNSACSESSTINKNGKIKKYTYNKKKYNVRAIIHMLAVSPIPCSAGSIYGTDAEAYRVSGTLTVAKICLQVTFKLRVNFGSGLPTSAKYPTVVYAGDTLFRDGAVTIDKKNPNIGTYNLEPAVFPCGLNGSYFWQNFSMAYPGSLDVGGATVLSMKATLKGTLYNTAGTKIVATKVTAGT